MRNFLVLLALTISCANSSIAQTEANRDRSGLVGPVRTLRLDVAKVSTVSGQPVEEPRVPLQVISFDEKGKVTGQTVFNLDGSLKRKLGWAYTYDARGRETERTFLSADGVLTSKAVSTYDERGRKVETTFFNPNGSVNHIQASTYDDRGNKIQEVHRNLDGTVRNTSAYTYDANGRLIEVSLLYKADGTLNQKNVYTYDSKGRETGWFIYHRDGPPAMGLNRSYDERGNVIESVHQSKGVSISRETFTYEFDSRGNWVKRKTEREMTRDGKTKMELEVTYRTIIYY